MNHLSIGTNSRKPPRGNDVDGVRWLSRTNEPFVGGDVVAIYGARELIEMFVVDVCEHRNTAERGSLISCTPLGPLPFSAHQLRLLVSRPAIGLMLTHWTGFVFAAPTLGVGDRLLGGQGRALGPLFLHGRYRPPHGRGATEESYCPGGIVRADGGGLPLTTKRLTSDVTPPSPRRGLGSPGPRINRLLSGADRKMGTESGTKLRETASNQCDKAQQVGCLIPVDLRF